MMFPFRVSHKLLGRLVAVVSGIALGFSLVASPVAAQQKFVSLGTASASGGYYLIGAGLAQIASRHSDLKVVAESTAGSVENLNLVLRKRLDMGMTSFLVIPEIGEERDLGDLRVIATGHAGPLHWFVREDSDISSLEDIAGKRVSVGAPGSGHNVAVRAALEHGLGLTMDDIEPVHLNIPETLSAIQDGTIDVGTIASTIPVPAVTELATTVGIQLLPLSEDALARIEENSDFGSGTIPAGTYPDQDEAVSAMYFTPAVLHAHKDLPDDVAYAFIKALYENEDEIKALHPAASLWTSGEVFRGTRALAREGIPFHPGVERYLKEAGLWQDPANGYLSE